MKVDFDNMRRQLLSNYNRVVGKLNAHIDNGTLEMDDFDLTGLKEALHDLKMPIVCLVFMSGENETFGEVGTDDTEFLNLNIGDEDDD